MKRDKAAPYVGVDVGGTKILAALVDSSGAVLGRERCPTPRGGAPKEVLEAVLTLIEDLATASGLETTALKAVGLAVPGIVDPVKGRVVCTPNMNLSGLEVVSRMEKRLGTPVVLGNDVNLGTLGEKWLGAARTAQSVVGIFVGTGIGGGVILDGRVVEGARGAAGEIGHIVMQVGGPRCGCGNRGCLEALASRTAIERDIRQALDAGEKSILTRLADDGDLAVIRSRMLKKALRRRDPLVTRVLRTAGVYLGHACLTVRHLLDPETIVLGGGVMEACGDFLMPIVSDIVASDSLPGAKRGGQVLLSALGDDAVALGAVALAQQHVPPARRKPAPRRKAKR